MSKSTSQVEREVVMAHLAHWWRHSQLAQLVQPPTVSDQGHGIDVVCPLVYYSQPFDPQVLADLAQLSAYTRDEVRGYERYLLTIADGTWAGETLPLTMALNQDWTLGTPTGDVVVLRQADLVNGATVAFVLPDATTFNAVVTSSYLNGVGYMTVSLTELGCEAIQCGSDAPYEAKVRARFMIASPLNNAPQLADQYGGAVSRLFRRIRFKADAAAEVGTPERDMADSSVHWIYQSDREPIQERPNHVANLDGWAWFTFSVVLRRLFSAPARGLVTVAA